MGEFKGGKTAQGGNRRHALLPPSAAHCRPLPP